MSFSGTVLPLIQNKCEGCHSGADPASNTTLSTHEDVIFLVNNDYLIEVNHHNLILIETLVEVGV